jgi:hypothetical protein
VNLVAGGLLEKTDASSLTTPEVTEATARVEVAPLQREVMCFENVTFGSVVWCDAFDSATSCACFCLGLGVCQYLFARTEAFCG